MDTLDEIIIAYREIIDERYQYDAIQKVYDLPPTFDSIRVDEFRAYFLDYLYPSIDKRKDLNLAFQQLDTYIKQPEKIFRLLLDSTALLFKYGRHLRKILKAAMQALKAFRMASRFENKLATAADQNGFTPPFAPNDIHTLIRHIPREEVDQFIEQNAILFQTLHDRKLVKKIIDVLSDLVQKMRKRPKTYSKEEVRGLEMGLEIVVKGNMLFDQLSPSEQKELLQFAIDYERQMIDHIYS